MVRRILPDLFQEATLARLGIIRGLDLACERPVDLSERVAGPDEKLLESLAAEARLSEALPDVLDHLRVRLGDQLARKLHSLLALRHRAVLLPNEVGRVLVFQVV